LQRIVKFVSAAEILPRSS